jgi:HSP20 family molecular chaperone IbpA
VDEATSSAKYNNGVLELTLPKRQAVSAKKLRVE